MAHNPIDRFLVSYVAGHLNTQESLLAAAFLTLNPDARHRVEQYEICCGQALEDCIPADVCEDVLDNIFQKD